MRRSRRPIASIVDDHDLALLDRGHALFKRAAGVKGQNGLWSYLAGGVLRLHLPGEFEWQRIQQLMNQYADFPLDMADASLVSAAELLGQRRVFSIDERLRAVRLLSGNFLELIP
jgi:hypothetical protein